MSDEKPKSRVRQLFGALVGFLSVWIMFEGHRAFDHSPARGIILIVLGVCLWWVVLAKILKVPKFPNKTVKKPPSP